MYLHHVKHKGAITYVNDARRHKIDVECTNNVTYIDHVGGVPYAGDVTHKG